jgi:hypothetical protein
VYENTNEILVRQHEEEVSLRKGTIVDNNDNIDKEEGEAQLLNLEEQVELQDTVASLMEEVKALKKKVATSGAGGGGRGATIGEKMKQKKLKHKIGGKDKKGAAAFAGDGDAGMLSNLDGSGDNGESSSSPRGVLSKGGTKKSKGGGSKGVGFSVGFEAYVNDDGEDGGGGGDGGSIGGGYGARQSGSFHAYSNPMERARAQSGGGLVGGGGSGLGRLGGDDNESDVIPFVRARAGTGASPAHAAAFYSGKARESGGAGSSEAAKKKASRKSTLVRQLTAKNKKAAQLAEDEFERDGNL